MSYQMTVPLDDVKRVFEVLLAHARATVGPRLSLTEDYFWSIPPPDLYNVYSEPAELTIGQLSESWANLGAVLSDPGAASSFALTWLADILRAIGLTIVG